MSCKKYDGLIFDLDGTLWDASRPICASWNEVLQKHKNIQRKPFTQEELMSHMGRTMDEIAESILPDEPKAVQMALMQEMCQYENEYLAAHGGTLFDGVQETLAALCARYRLFIVSNCQDGYIETFIKAHRMEAYIEDTECWGRTKLPKSGSNKLLIARNRLTNPIYIGDTQGDADAAKAAGIPFIWASYGFGDVRRKDCAGAVDNIQRLGELLAQLEAKEENERKTQSEIGS